jgi:gas vesicle protein
MANDNSGSVMVAFVLGALTGAAVALLFAPASGEETREYLGEKAREGKARVREGREHLIAAVERGREAFERERGDQV